MSLRKQQSEFVQCIGKLIEFAYQNNFELTFGDSYRDPRIHGYFGAKKSYSAAKSVHKMRLACDLNLFVNGEWITNGEDLNWKQLGDYWKTLHPLARWGGDFNDSNHFSFEYNGCK